MVTGNQNLKTQKAEGAALQGQNFRQEPAPHLAIPVTGQGLAPTLTKEGRMKNLGWLGIDFAEVGPHITLEDPLKFSQTRVRGTNRQEFEGYLAHADDGNGIDITTGKPLKTFDEWMAA